MTFCSEKAFSKRRSKMKTQSILVLVMVCVLLALNSGTQAVTIDWVTVGNAGNIADTEVMSDGTTGYGSVGYEYQIGKYEVTAGQYTEFLNAVAATDTYGLYNSDMWEEDPWGDFGCKIQQSGSSGSYTYSVAADWANRPVNYTSFYDSLRFANWLHNGQPTGPQDYSTTENGAYDMSLGDSVVRMLGALVWLTSEDEWYKAAYHKNDGVTGNYFDYPTSSDTVPGRDMDEVTNPGNNANYIIDTDFLIGSPYYRTEVGEFELSDSPYGTFDMGGNVWEWNETPIGFFRGVRGGSYFTDDYYLSSSTRIYAPHNEFNNVGFRVASVPEPCSLVLLSIGGLTLLRKRRT